MVVEGLGWWWRGEGGGGGVRVVVEGVEWRGGWMRGWRG